jgi:hypothetical protein
MLVITMASYVFAVATSLKWSLVRGEDANTNCTRAGSDDDISLNADRGRACSKLFALFSDALM